MKSLMKLGEGHEQNRRVMGPGLETRSVGMGLGKVLSSSPQQPSPIIPLTGEPIHTSIERASSPKVPEGY